MNTRSYKEYAVEGERLIFTNMNSGNRTVAAVRIAPFGIFAHHWSFSSTSMSMLKIFNAFGIEEAPVYFLPAPVDKLTPENLVEHLLRAGRISAFRDINRSIREMEPKL